MNTTELDTIWIGAFRYYLGRTSYAVSDFCNLVIKEKAIIPPLTQDLMRQEIYKALDFGKAGQEQDRKCWERVAKELED